MALTPNEVFRDARILNDYVDILERRLDKELKNNKHTDTYKARVSIYIPEDEEAFFNANYDTIHSKLCEKYRSAGWYIELNKMNPAGRLLLAATLTTG